VLLRRLVHSTDHDLRQVDFPGYDNAERKGSDGIIESDAPTAWIPDGKSFWEFGVNKSRQVKAEKDYRAIGRAWWTRPAPVGTESATGSSDWRPSGKVPERKQPEL